VSFRLIAKSSCDTFCENCYQIKLIYYQKIKRIEYIIKTFAFFELKEYNITIILPRCFMTVRTKKQNFAYWFLIFATFFMYIVLTGSKNLYVAEKTTMTAAGFNSVALASTMEYYFYAYAAMQLALVFFMQKVNIKWYLAVTITLSAILTILISFTSTVEHHWVIFIVNGIMQAGIWGCSIKTLGHHLPSDLLPNANSLMSSGPAVAYFLSYGVASVFGENWKLPFIVLGIVLIIAVALFVMAVNLANKYPREKAMHHVVHADGSEEDVSDEDKNDFIHLKNKKRKFVFYAFSLFFGLIITFLYFSLNNIVDYFLSNVGGFDNTTSKLISMVILVITVIGPVLTVRACEKQTNFLKVAFVFFGLALLCSVALLVLSILNVQTFAVLVVFYLLFLVLTNGGRTISLSVAALKMRDKIDTGVYSTMVNVAASVSAGVAPKIYTIIVNPEATAPALIHQNWINAFTVSVVLGAITVSCIAFLIVWIKRLNKKDAKTDAIV